MSAIATIWYVAASSTSTMPTRLPQRKDMQFSTDLLDAHWDESQHIWHVKTSKDEEIRVRYLVTALGLLSAINWPSFPGRDSFKGQLMHTGAWPEGTDLTGKRVAVVRWRLVIDLGD
jgi:cyclohexanone monooxygenase